MMSHAVTKRRERGRGEGGGVRERGVKMNFVECI